MDFILWCLCTETGLDAVLGLDGVDVGVELGVVGDLLPLDQGVGQGEGLLELGSWEGGEERRVAVVGVLALVETEGWVGLGLYYFFSFREKLLKKIQRKKLSKIFSKKFENIFFKI